MSDAEKWNLLNSIIDFKKLEDIIDGPKPCLDIFLALIASVKENNIQKDLTTK